MTVPIHDNKSEPVDYAFCKECGGSEQINNIKYTREFLCDECLLENDNKERERYV